MSITERIKTLVDEVDKDLAHQLRAIGCTRVERSDMIVYYLDECGVERFVVISRGPVPAA